MSEIEISGTTTPLKQLQIGDLGIYTRNAQQVGSSRTGSNAFGGFFGLGVS
jgi:hypothetical protein